MIKVLGLIFLIIGSCIGAGFASGKEIANYFARFGLVSIFFAMLFGVVFYFLVKKCLVIGKQHEKKDTSQIFYHIFGKVSPVVNLMVIISSIIIVASMLAGSRDIGVYLLSKNYYAIIPIITFGVAFFVLLGGFNSVDKFNLILMPIVLIVIFFVCLFTVKNGFLDRQFFNFSVFNVLFSFVSTVNYFCMTLLLIGVFFVQIGKNYSYKQIKIASLISTIILTIFIIFVIVALLVAGNGVINSDMPLVTLAFNVSKILGILASVVIWFGLITTVIASSFVVVNYFTFSKKPIIIFATLFLSFLISMLGFAFIVVNFYAIIGVFGCYFVYYLIRHDKKNYC